MTSEATRSLRPLEWLAVSVVALAALCALRLATLDTPYWWDAGAVYAPGAKWLLDHGFDARPAVFPSDLGRGHTPLFYLITAFAYRLAGATPVTGHAVVLGFATMALAYTYALGAWLHGRLAGAAAAVLLVVTPLYLTMSSETLPEVPLTALTVASLYAFARGRFRESALWGCALVLIKETGVACPLAILGALTLDAWRTRDFVAYARRAALAATPLAALLAFFVWQRVAEGWWVLPYHAGLFHERHSLAGQLVRVARSIFVVDGRALLVAAALVAFVVRRARGERVDDPRHASTVTAVVLVAAANLVFFTKMFFLERYVLPAHPGLLVLAAGALFPARAPAPARVGAVGVVALCAALALANRTSGDTYASGELTFAYLRAVRVHQQLFRAMEARGGDPAILTSWPMTDELRHPFLGWVSRPHRAISLEWHRLTNERQPIDAVVVFDGIGGAEALRREARERGFHVIRREQIRSASIEWWGR